MSETGYDTYYWVFWHDDGEVKCKKWLSESQARSDAEHFRPDSAVVVERETREQPSEEEMRDVLDQPAPDAQEPDSEDDS